MPQQAIEYQDVFEHARDRRARRTKIALMTAGGVAATLLLLVIAFFVYANYHQVWSVKRLFANSPDWDVVEVTGYSDEPGYSVTGVLLAAKGRPEATVRLVFNQWTSLRDNSEISIVSMRDINVADVQRRLLADPRLPDRQRYELQYQPGSIDVKSTGHFAGMFPHPIRDLKDLRSHYEEVYAAMRSVATRPTTKPVP